MSDITENLKVGDTVLLEFFEERKITKEVVKSISPKMHKIALVGCMDSFPCNGVMFKRWGIPGAPIRQILFLTEENIKRKQELAERKTTERMVKMVANNFNFDDAPFPLIQTIKDFFKEYEDIATSEEENK